MTLVKICGITTLSDARLCIEAGADFLGFVTEFPVPVPWNMPRAQSKALIDSVRAHVTTVVVTSGPAEKILEIGKYIKPAIIQLHGRETLADIRLLADALSEMDVRVIKALSIEAATGLAFFEIQEPVAAAMAIEKAHVWAITVDSKTAAMPAGTGQKCDWSLAKKIKENISIPMILAGGLTFENVGKAKEQVAPFGVDVISGVEKTIGVKDPGLVKLFIRETKR